MFIILIILPYLLGLAAAAYLVLVSIFRRLYLKKDPEPAPLPSPARMP